MSAERIENKFGVVEDGDYMVLFEGKITLAVTDAMNLAAWIAACTESEEVYDMAKGIEAQQEEELD